MPYCIDDIYPTKNYSAVSRAVTDDDTGFLYQELTRASHWTGFEWFLAPEPQSTIPLPVPTVDSLLRVEGFYSTAKRIMFLCQSLAVSQAQITQVEKMTRGQRTNPNWSLYRTGSDDDALQVLPRRSSSTRHRGQSLPRHCPMAKQIQETSNTTGRRHRRVVKERNNIQDGDNIDAWSGTEAKAEAQQDVEEFDPSVDDSARFNIDENVRAYVSKYLRHKLSKGERDNIVKNWCRPKGVEFDTPIY